MFRTLLVAAVLALFASCAGCSGSNVTHVCLTCGDLCVDSQTDPKNCGSCGTICGGGQACVSGICEVSCGDGLTTCGTGCADTKIDPLHCGACGTACAANEACVNSQCKATCQAPLSACSGACVDTQHDPAHCGTCTKVCATGQACLAGGCVSTCVSPQQMCGNACVNTMTDRGNCGSCGNPCAAGFVCTGGACQLSCQASELTCDAGVGGGLCVTAGSDNRNCGACGVACGPFEHCEAGVCVQPIPTPRTCAEALRDGGSVPRTVTLYVDGQPNLPFDALCGIDGGMYLPLAHQESTANYSHGISGGGCLGFDVVTNFQAVRVDVLDGGADGGASQYGVVGNDLTYAVSSGGLLFCVDLGSFSVGSVMDEWWGQTFDCMDDSTQPSDFNIDLRGTPFAVGATDWADAGLRSYVTQKTVSNFRQVVNVQGGGFCGGAVPTSGRYVLLRSCPAPGAEVCDRLDNNCDGLVDNLADGGTCP